MDNEVQPDNKSRAVLEELAAYYEDDALNPLMQVSSMIMEEENEPQLLVKIELGEEKVRIRKSQIIKIFKLRRPCGANTMPPTRTRRSAATLSCKRRKRRQRNLEKRRKETRRARTRQRQKERREQK